MRKVPERIDCVRAMRPREAACFHAIIGSKKICFQLGVSIMGRFSKNANSPSRLSGSDRLRRSEGAPLVDRRHMRLPRAKVP